MNRQIVFLIPLVLFGSGCWPSSSSEESASTSPVANPTSDDVPIHPAAKHVMYPPAPKKIDVQVSQGTWIIGGTRVDFADAEASLVSILGPADPPKPKKPVSPPALADEEEFGGGFPPNIDYGAGSGFPMANPQGESSNDGGFGMMMDGESGPTKLIWNNYGIAAEFHGVFLNAIYFVLNDPPGPSEMAMTSDFVTVDIHAETSFSGTITLRNSKFDGSKMVHRDKFLKPGMTRDAGSMVDGRDVKIHLILHGGGCVEVAELMNWRSKSE